MSALHVRGEPLLLVAPEHLRSSGGTTGAGSILLALLLLPAALVGWRQLHQSSSSPPPAQEEQQAEPPDSRGRHPGPAPAALGCTPGCHPRPPLPPPQLYASAAQTIVIGFKVAPLPAASGSSDASPSGQAPPAPQQDASAASAADQTYAATVDASAARAADQTYAATADSVRSAAAAALADVLKQNQLTIMNVQAATFPGCVHLVVSMQLPGSCPAGAADRQQRLQRQLHAALQRQLPGPYRATMHAPPAGAEVQPCLHPVALPSATATGGGTTTASSRVEVELPSSWLQQLAVAGATLRVVVTPASSAAPAGGQGAATPPQAQQRVDVTLTAADAAPGPLGAGTRRLAVHVPAALRAGAVSDSCCQPQLLQVHVLVLGEAGEQLLAQLPLLVLPPAACSELERLFADMVASMGGDAGRAFATSFAPLARDLGVALQPPAAGEAATPWRPAPAQQPPSAGTPGRAAAPAEGPGQRQLRLTIIRGLLRFLAQRQPAMPACVALAADAASSWGLHHASLQVG